jgi:hypothetical protein
LLIHFQADLQGKCRHWTFIEMAPGRAFWQ